MRRVFKAVVLFCFLFLLFGFPTFADDSAQNFKDSFYDAIPDDFEWMSDEENLLSGVGIDSLINELISAFMAGRGEFFSFFSLILGISLLLCLAEFAPFIESSAFSSHISGGIAMISGIVIFNSIEPTFSSVKSGIDTMGDFFSSIIPILTGINVAGGNVGTAGVQAVNMNTTLGLISWISSHLLLPLAFMLFALALINGVGLGAISALSKWIKNFFGWILGIGTAVIIGGVSMQSLVASASDGAYLKAARYAASGMIPIVGSLVSSSLAALAGGLSYVKSTVGVSSVVVIVFSSLMPLLALVLRRAAFSVCITFMEFLGVSGGVRCFSAFRTALDTLISVYTLSMLVYVSEIIIFMKSGVDVFG